ncbi:MAG TPA: hypothetical protein PK785_00955 [Bacteroidales bacterium]|nr:hypothetical protein [Bacteroidales bacterium]
MAEKYLTGLAKIEIGDIAADGGVATSFVTLGQVYKDTAKLEQAEGEEIEHEVENVDDPVFSFVTKGKTTITWAIIDYDADTLVKVLGGTATGTAPNKKWEAPDSAPVLEKSVLITPKSGSTITIPRVSLRARIDYQLTRSGIAQVIISGKVLQPTKTGVKSIQIG